MGTAQGMSKSWLTQWSHATHVADVADFIRGLKAGPVVLVGQSYGSQIAAIVAAQHPELVRGKFLNEPLR